MLCFAVLQHIYIYLFIYFLNFINMIDLSDWMSKCCSHSQVAIHQWTRNENGNLSYCTFKCFVCKQQLTNRVQYIIYLYFKYRTLTYSGVFSQCGIDTFTKVKNLNTFSISVGHNRQVRLATWKKHPWHVLFHIIW